MQFTQKSLAKLKQLFLEKFSENLSDEEVVRRAEYIVDLYKAVYSGVEFLDNKIEEEEKR